MDSEATVSLSSKIRELFKESIVFNPNMFETTLGVLCNKLASHTGRRISDSVDRARLQTYKLFEKII